MEFKYDHYSRLDYLDELNPRYHGMGFAGSERQVKTRYGELFVNRIYLYKRDTKPEYRFKNLFKYSGVFRGKIYDARADNEKENVMILKTAKMILKNKGYLPGDFTAVNQAYIKAVKSLGYGLIICQDGNAILLKKIKIGG